MAGEPSHVILPRPPALQALWRAHVDVMSRRLLVRVHDTVLERRGEAKSLGARPGLIATRHAWTPTLLRHPHVPCRVTGGGLTADGQGRAVRKGFLRPVWVVRAVLRGKWRAVIRQELAHGNLALPQDKRAQPVENRRNRLGRTTWHAPIRERDAHGQGVWVYWARSRRGGPLAQRRLLACEGEPVVFQDAERAKGPWGQAPPRTLRLALAQCMGHGWSKCSIANARCLWR